MPTWEGREPSCGTVRFAGEAWTGVIGGRGGWDLPGDLEIDVWMCGLGGGGQGKKLESTDTGKEERPGCCGGSREWQGSRGGDEAKLCRSEARLWGSDRTGKGMRLFPRTDYGPNTNTVEGEGEFGPNLQRSGSQTRHSLLIISSSHGSTSAYHPPPSPRRPHNALFLLFLQPCLIHPYLLWLPHLMAPWLLR